MVVCQQVWFLDLRNPTFLFRYAVGSGIIHVCTFGEYFWGRLGILLTCYPCACRSTRVLLVTCRGCNADHDHINVGESKDCVRGTLRPIVPNQVCGKFPELVQDSWSFFARGEGKMRCSLIFLRVI